jgi:hypothetical protein
MGELVNPWVGRGYINDNPRMPIPPAHFLAAIYDQDAMLVLLPSRQRAYTYVVARRRQLTAGLKYAPPTPDTPEDTKMCLEHDVVPVCLMFQMGASWNPDPLIKSLRARDLWTHGGGDKAADLLEQQEEAEKAQLKAEIRDDLYNRSGAAWRSYQARTGQRVAGLKGLTPQPEQRVEISSSSSTVGSGVGA